MTSRASSIAPRSPAASARPGPTTRPTMAAIRMAQEALASSPFGTGPLSRFGLGADIQQQLAQAAAQIQANDQALLAQYGGIAEGDGLASAGAARSRPGGGAENDPIALIERLARHCASRVRSRRRSSPPRGEDPRRQLKSTRASRVVAFQPGSDLLDSDQRDRARPSPRHDRRRQVAFEQCPRRHAPRLFLGVMATFPLIAIGLANS